MYICKMYRVNSSSEEVSHHYRSSKSLELWKFTSTKIFIPLSYSHVSAPLSPPHHKASQNIFTVSLSLIYVIYYMTGGKWIKRKQNKKKPKTCKGITFSVKTSYMSIFRNHLNSLFYWCCIIGVWWFNWCIHFFILHF